MTSPPIGTDQELIERHIVKLKREAIRLCGDACTQTEQWQLADALQSRISEVERLREALQNIAEGNLGDRPWEANYARIREVASAALSQQGKV